MYMKSSAPTQPKAMPRFVRDGIDLYIHVDDLCRNLMTVPLTSPVQVASALQTWKSSLMETPGPRPVVQKAMNPKTKKLAKRLAVLAAFIMLLPGCSGCDHSHTDPLGSSATQDPTPGPTAGPTPTTLLATGFDQASDISAWADTPGTQAGGTGNNPRIFVGASPYHTGPGSALFPAYSTTSNRHYEQSTAAPTYGHDIQVTYYAFGAPREVTFGYYVNGHQISAFKFVVAVPNYNVTVAGQAVTVVQTYTSTTLNQWHAYKGLYHAATHLTDYWVDGLQVATGVDSYTYGPSFGSLTGFSVQTKLGYDDAQIDDLLVQAL